MCFGAKAAERRSRKAAETQAAELRRREAERQQQVEQGRVGINSAFEQFDDEFFGGFKDAFTSAQFPSLDQQFGDARGKLVAALAGRGMLESTVGADALADLQQKNDDTRVDIGNNAQDAANQLRARIEGSKSDLFRLNTAGADPQGLNTRALASASSLAAPPSVSPLGNVFASLVDPAVAFTQARNNRAGRRYVSPVASGAGSGRVVS